MDFKRIIRKVLHTTGFDIVRAPSVGLFDHLGIDTVFDIGANEGQYAEKIRTLGYRGRIVSFEPLSAAHAVLQRRAARDPLWDVHPRCAIGGEAGEITINIAGNSVSSSVLPMLEAHEKSAPRSVYVGQETVPVTTIAEVLPRYRSAKGGTFAKIDTQGFEKAVLHGALDVLDELAGVQLELSLVPLYEGSELYTYFLDFLREKGFVLWDIENGFVDVKSSRLLQFDGVFVNAKLAG